MKDNGFVLFLKGIVVGIANMIAGISGGTLAFILGIFTKVVTAFANLTKKGYFWESFLYLLKFALGVAVGLLLCAKALDFLFGIAMLEVATLFAGVLIGGVVNDMSGLKLEESQKAHKWKYFIGLIIAFAVVVGLSILNITVFSPDKVNHDERWTDVSFSQMIILFFSIVIGAIAMIFPGISGSMVFMIFGIYYPVLNAISDLTKISLYSSWGFWANEIKIVVPLLIGAVISLLFISKPIKMLLERHYTTCLYIIMGFVLGSIVSVYVLNFNNIASQFTWWHMLIAMLVALPLGVFTSIGLHKLSHKITTRKEEKSEIKESE